MFKEKLRTILHSYFQKIEEEGRLLSSFHEARITIISKPDRVTEREKTVDHYLSQNVDTKVRKASANRSQIIHYT